jgi:Rps23 Pro-64 3,4-dihydroxylase Tpa1-like proline 4-hydroxylase
VILIRNALPPEKAEELREIMLRSRYERETQSVAGFYGSRMLSDLEHMPGTDETFTASFGSAAVQDEPAFLNAFAAMFPKIKEAVGEVADSYGNVHIVAYRMNAGDHLRFHVDEYLGRGFVLYLSKGWKWDWGGLLMLADGDGVKPYLPQFNDLVVMPNEKVPHCVTEVSANAGEPRYTMTGFMR